MSHGLRVDHPELYAHTGTLLEAKGPGYDWAVEDGKFRDDYQGAEGIKEQAFRQRQAAMGMPVIWHVAEENAANAIRNLVSDFGIKVVFTPPI